jgi:hypothetical protein
MLFRETVAVYCENRTEHTDTLCGGRMQSVSVLKQAVLVIAYFKFYLPLKKLRCRENDVIWDKKFSRNEGSYFTL